MKPGTVLTQEEDFARVTRAMNVVAVVGMKDETESGTPAFLIPRRVQEAGVRVIPVNPKLSVALGEKAFAKLADIPCAFDMVNVFRRSEAVEGVADEILALPSGKRPKVVWMQSGVSNTAAARKLTVAGIDVVMDQCLGVYASRYRRD